MLATATIFKNGENISFNFQMQFFIQFVAAVWWRQLRSCDVQSWKFVLSFSLVFLWYQSLLLSLSESSNCLQPRWPLRSYNHQLFFTVWSWVSWCQTMHGLLMLIGHVSLLLFFTSSIQVNKLENYGMSKSTEGPRSSNTFSLAIPYQSTVIEPCEWNDKCQIEGKP